LRKERREERLIPCQERGKGEKEEEPQFLFQPKSKKKREENLNYSYFVRGREKKEGGPTQIVRAHGTEFEDVRKKKRKKTHTCASIAKEKGEGGEKTELICGG